MYQMPSSENQGIYQNDNYFRTKLMEEQCDRKNPCSACILRGCDAECEYARTDEDRYHIGQAKEIENLRKELNRLKRRLEDGEQQVQTQAQTQAQAQSYESAEDHGYGAVAARPNKRRIGEEGNVTELWTPAVTAVAGMPYSGSNGFTQTEMSQQSYFMPGEQQQQQQQQYHQHVDPTITTSSSSSNNNNNNNNPIVKSAHPPQYNLDQIQQHPQPDFWRGKQKQLETIYKIVCDCDEYWVPSIIDIVRTSLSPEDAITSIRSLLRGSGSNSSYSKSYIYSYSNSNNSNDGGTVLARSTTTTASDSRSPDSASSMVQAEVDCAPYSHDDHAMRFGRYLSPTDQSRSSGEG
jgi:hypothetical protein